MKSILNIGLVLFFAAGVLAAAEEQKEYTLAQSFTLKDVKGVEVTLDSLLAVGPVYMECWDLPCVNCIAELDALMPVYDTLKERGLQIIALSVDKPADEARVKAFVKSKKWPYICLLDAQNEVKKAYGIIIKPTAYLINQKGEIVYTHIGYKKGDEQRIKAEFLKWLPEEPAEEPAEEPGEENSGDDK
jgi:cytochrome c biogenesis protein CcmG/thiol:disulfide interchange protein DsbE